MASVYIDDRYFVVRDGVKVRTAYTGAQRYRVRWREHAKGTQKSKSYKRLTDAREKKASIEHSLRAGTYVNPDGGRETFGDWWDRYRPSRLDLRESSSSRDEGYYRNHIKPRLGTVPLASIDRAMLRSWVADLSKAGLAPKTVRHAVGLVRQALEVAVGDKLIVANPADRLRGLPQVVETDMLIASPAEVAALAKVIDPRYRAWLLTTAYSGLRLGETAALRRNKVDLIRKRLDVVASSTEVNGRVVTGPPKTKAGRRSVPLPDPIVEVLTEHCAGLGPTDLVLPSPTGEVLRRASHRRRCWVPATVAAGLGQLEKDDEGVKRYTGLRIHDLRHTAASFWIDSGANVKQLTTWAGHTSVATLLDRYGHLLPDREEAVMEALGALARTSPAELAEVVAIGS